MGSLVKTEGWSNMSKVKVPPQPHPTPPLPLPLSDVKRETWKLAENHGGILGAKALVILIEAEMMKGPVEIMGT